MGAVGGSIGCRLVVFIAVLGLEALCVQPVLRQPPHHHLHAAMRDEHALRARAGDRLLQPGPVRVVRHHEAAVHAAPPARAAQLHPSAGERIGIVAEAAHPRRALRRRRGQHQRALQQRRVDTFVAHAQRRRQRHACRAVHGIERLHRPVHHDRPDARVHPVQDALRLAEGIAEQHRSAPRLGIGAPPCVDLREQRGLRGPAVDRQAEGGFGDEGVARHRLEGGAGAVGLGLVVARGHPHAPAMLEPHLRRAQHVPGRMQGDAHAVVRDGFAVGQGLQVDVGAQPRAQGAGAVGVGQVVPVPRACVVRMGVGDDGARHRPPGVDVEIARRAVQALGPGDDEIFLLRCGHGTPS